MKNFTTQTFLNVLFAAQKLKAAKALLVTLLLSCIAFEGYATAWTTTTAGDISVLANWTDGAASSPTTFTTPGDTWTVTLAMTLPAPTLSVSWTVGTAASAPDTVTFVTGGSLALSGAGTVFTITIYGDLIMSGGALNLGGAGTSNIDNIYGDTYVSAGPAGGAIYTNGAGSGMIFNAYGNYTMTGGSVVANGAGGTVNMNVHGNFNMSGGIFNADGASCVNTLKIYGNGSFNGTAAMTTGGAGCTSFLHFSLPNGSAGTPMLIDNTSTGVWSGTEAYIDTNCTAQLDGNFSTNMGAPGFPATTYGLAVNGTLNCPAAYMINGTNFFTLDAVGTLEVGIATGINGAIITSGTKTFNDTANYVFNGTVAQVTGSYLPVSLFAPDTITINNSAGVTLSQTTATTGTLLFASGILNTTAAYTMSVPGAAAAVTGAGASSYVNGTLIKTISGLTIVNYEVGDVDYAPMALTLSTTGTGGSIGLKTTGGLHPSVATSGLSTANMANHYWTITNIGAAGPATIVPVATYNAADIIGGSNASFVTQEYTDAAWLSTSLATTNTSSPYTSKPATAIALATLAGDYIFGNIFCGTLPITGTATVCAGLTTALSDATTGGVWSSGAVTIATVSATGVVGGVSGGTATISYTNAGCTVTDVVTINPAPNAGTITGGIRDTLVCVSRTDTLSDAAGSGTWSSSHTSLATVNASGVVFGVAAGIDTIVYTVTNACGTATAKLRVKVVSTAACRADVDPVPEAAITELKIFPNPNKGAFTINLLSANDEAVQVIIMNITGEKVEEFTTTTNNATDIKLNPVPGIYLISASTANGKYFAKVIVE